MALKEQQKLEKELTGYVEWICRAGEGNSAIVWGQTKTIYAKQQINIFMQKDLFLSTLSFELLFASLAWEFGKLYVFRGLSSGRR